MTSPDARYLRRRESIERAKRASKFGRAALQLRKHLIHWWFVNQSAPIRQISIPKDKNLLISVAFNDPELIELQARALKKFVSGDYSFLVVDNSPDSDKRAAINLLSRELGFFYCPSPPNPYSWVDPSISHSLVLDWAWKNIVRRSAPKIVVFLDHDVFPIRDVAIDQLIQGSLAAGYRRESGERWLLWPGLLALNFSRIDSFNPTFMPRNDTDSGGSLWWRVFSRVAESNFRFLKREDLVFGDTSNRFGDGSSGEMHILDGSWLHLVDGSGWSDGVAKTHKLPLGGKRLTVEGLVAFAHSIPTSADS